MDLYCQRCGEPWDFYGVYHGDLEPEEKDDFIKGRGCPACNGQVMCTRPNSCQDCDQGAENSQGIFTCLQGHFKRPFRAELASVLTDILGEDVDGIAAEMEDAEWLFGKGFWE
jgi:hypothetical protein